MSEIEIVLDGDRFAFHPLEELRGRVRWRLDGGSADSIAVQLLWHTEGKGTRDADVVETVTIEQPSARGERTFSFRLPAGPYSCSGKLLSVVWKLQTVIEPSDEVTQTEIVIAPGDAEVDLSACGEEAGDATATSATTPAEGDDADDPEEAER